MARSNKPIVWGLFAGGGTVTAFLSPVLVLVLGLAVPFGLYSAEDLSYDRVMAVIGNPLGALVLFGFITLALWHAAHRTRTTVHDLGIHNDAMTAKVCYGLAALGTLAAAVALVQVAF
ncbi:MAG: fumarate reductase subunit D [Flavobacteriales bacterium]|nr:fumarate reductase subunit D [Flavobacteriales bacterium]MCB2101883.1 fumarate reductase subunit D [Rhodobacterales bacterium]